MKVVIDTDGTVAQGVRDHQREQRNEALKKQINSYPLVIDRSVFKKTKKEKQKVNRLRLEFKNKQD